jgi:hypothetical protein
MHAQHHHRNENELERQLWSGAQIKMDLQLDTTRSSLDRQKQTSRKARKAKTAKPANEFAQVRQQKSGWGYRQIVLD